MKKPILIFICIIVALFVVALFKDLIIKVSVEGGAEFVTGLKLSIRSFHVGILRPVVSIKGLTIYNPSSFPDRTMLDMPQIYVNYDLGAILQKDIHLRQVDINLKQFIVVKNAKGELNLNSLKVVKAQKENKPPEGEKGAAIKMRIDKLHLKIGKVIYKDYSAGSTPSVREFNINIDETFTDIQNPYTLVSLIVVKSLANTTISNLTNFDIRGLQGNISSTLSTAQQVAGQAKQQTGEVVKNAQDVVRDVGNVFKSFGGK